MNPDYPTTNTTPAKPFENTPKGLRDFLAGCPSVEPACADPKVAVVVEDQNGQIQPIVHAWYDQQRGMVRLAVEAVFQDSEDE